MPETLQTNALCTVAQARAWLRRDGITSAVEDEVLTLDINGVSDAIAAYCNRRFLPKSPAADTDQPVTRYFTYDGVGTLPLAPFELRSLGGGSGYGGTGSIVVYSDQPTGNRWTLTAATATAEAEYRLSPRAGTDQSTYYDLTLPRIDGSYPYGIEVAVTGYWGVGSVPGAVRTACLIAVAANYRNPEGAASRVIEGFSISEPVEDQSDLTGTALPPKARSFLWAYRR